MEIIILSLPEEEGALQTAFSSVKYQPKRTFAHYRFKKDQLLHYFGDILIQYVLDKYATLRPEEWSYRVGSHGKLLIHSPFKKVEVNLSYASGNIICVLDDISVGVDVEKKVSLDWKQLIDQLHPHEQRYICGIDTFYEIWTKKESYLKYLGVGLSVPLSHSDMTSLETNDFIKIEWKDYIAHICTNKEGAIDYHTHFISPEAFY